MLADEASVLSGRCLPYGEGITYWPLVEIFREADAEDELADGALGSCAGGHLLVCQEGARASRTRAACSRSSSRTSIGPSRPCSTSWSISWTGLATRRSCCCASRVPI